MLNIINDYFIENLEIVNIKEIQALATLYLQKKIIPEKKIFDALHIAMSVINNIDYLVSWNYKHLANVE